MRLHVSRYSIASSIQLFRTSQSHDQRTQITLCTMNVIIKDHSKFQSIKAPQRHFLTKKKRPKWDLTSYKPSVDVALPREHDLTPEYHLYMNTHAKHQRKAHISHLIFYHRKLQMTLITNPTIRSRLTYHYTNHWQALQRYTTTRSPPGIDVSTCTELWTRLVVSHSYTGQTWGGPL